LLITFFSYATAFCPFPVSIWKSRAFKILMGLPGDAQNVAETQPATPRARAGSAVVTRPPNPKHSKHTADAPPLKKFYIETHGCQMNLADSDIVASVLLSAGYESCPSVEEADLILTNTCAIRENSEAKIWQRLKYFGSLRKKARAGGAPPGVPKVGVLGCMAERLKDDMLARESVVDFIAGPDAYRDLPRLLGIQPAATTAAGGEAASGGMGVVDDDDDDYTQQPQATTDPAGASALLSLEETYADIRPVRMAEDNVHAFVTIQRGCDNHCAFCIVPYVRGMERSLPLRAVVDEVRRLSAAGVKEVVLLGQNVNSYYDCSSSDNSSDSSSGDSSCDSTSSSGNGNSAEQRRERRAAAVLAQGFSQPGQRQSQSQNRKETEGRGEMLVSAADTDFSPSSSPSPSPSPSPSSTALPPANSFADLLRSVAAVDPEMRVRFQSPHPKDFPDEVLRLIAQTPNICNSLHMPAQHGASSVLERMRRGYTREAYISLIQRARKIIAEPSWTEEGQEKGNNIEESAESPRSDESGELVESDEEQDGGVYNTRRLGLSSDFISGFCGETEGEHEELLSLVRQVGFDQAFTYSYSKREQTYAGLFYNDDVGAQEKQRRLQVRYINLNCVTLRYTASPLGTTPSTLLPLGTSLHLAIVCLSARCSFEALYSSNCQNSRSLIPLFLLFSFLYSSFRHLSSLFSSSLRQPSTVLFFYPTAFLFALGLLCTPHILSHAFPLHVDGDAVRCTYVVRTGISGDFSANCTS
jgi:tRNA A37 methylthiotransferase MiaB